MQRNLPRLASELKLKCSSNLKLWIKDSFVSLQNSFFFFCCCSGGRWMSVSSDIRTSTEVHFQLAFLAKNNEIELPFLSHSHYHSDSNSFSLPLSLFLTLVLFFLSYSHTWTHTHASRFHFTTGFSNSATTSCLWSFSDGLVSRVMKVTKNTNKTMTRYYSYTIG